MSKLWIIKDSLGNIHGPYETQELLIQIQNGVLNGEEQVASYPEGSWKRISTEPEFFDHLLSVIAGEKITTTDPIKNNNTEIEKTVPIESLEADQEKEKSLEGLSEVEEIGDVQNSIPDYEESLLPFESDEPDLVKGDKKPLQAVMRREAKGRSHLFEDRQEHTIQQLEKLTRKAEAQKKAKSMLYILCVAAIGLLLGLFFVQEKETQVDNAYKFQLPEKTKSNISITSSKSRNAALKRTLKLISTDSIENVIDSQKLLLAVLRFEPRNKDALLYLCNTNFRLWDFTNKTSKDLYVVSQLSKRAYSLGFSGDVLTSCRLTEKILYGKVKEAQEMANSYLNVEGANGQASFYLRYYKGHLLSLKGDLEHATSFLESSVKLESSWIPSLMLLGDLYKKLNRSQEAYNVFKRVLKVNKAHIGALYQLSILNIEFFSKEKTGMNFFKKAEELSVDRLVDLKIKSLALSTVAKMFFKKNKLNLAREYGQKAFQADPSNVSAKNILISTGAKTDTNNADKLFMSEADQLFNEGEWKAAIAIYEQAYLINRRNGLAAHRIAECYWKQSFIKDAIKWAELAIAADSKRVESYIILSDFLINQFEFTQASRVLMKAKGIEKSNYKIFRGFAKIEFLKKNYQYSAKFAKEALRIYSNDSESILILAKSFEQMGETEKAFANVRAAMEVSRSAFDLENYYSLLLMKTQGLDSAQQYLQQRLEASSGDLKYRVMLANVYYADEQYKMAAKVSGEINKLSDGEMIEAVKSYARAMGALGKVETALDFFQKSFLMNPTDAEPLFESGKLLIGAKKPEQAIKQFKRVYRISSNYPGLMHNWAEAAKLLAIRKKDASLAKEVINLSERELDKNPSYFESYLLIAEAYYILGNFAREKAQKLDQATEAYTEAYSKMVSWYKFCARSYRKAIDLGVQSGDNYIDMARCYRLSGELDLAAVSAERAEDFDSSNPRIWIEAALVHEQNGNHLAALKAYEKYQLIFPNAPNKNEVEKKVKTLKELTGE